MSKTVFDNGRVLVLWVAVEGFVGLGIWLGGQWEGIGMHCFGWDVYFNWEFGLGMWETGTLGLEYLRPLTDTTALVVNSYTLLYTYMEVISCQSDTTPKRLMISHTPRKGEPHISSGGSRNMEETLPVLGVSFAKPFLLKMGYS